MISLRLLTKLRCNEIERHQQGVKSPHRRLGSFAGALQYTSVTNGLILEILENCLIQNIWPRIKIQHPKLSLLANFHIPRVCDLDFMAIIDLRIYKGLVHELLSGCNFKPSVIIHGQFPCKFSNFVILIKLKSLPQSS